MRFHLLVPTIAALFLMSALAADEPKKGAREIEVKDLKVEQPRGEVKKPARITKKEELEKAVSGKEVQEKIAKQVDFAREHLLLFAWQGSGGDKLSVKTEDEKGKVVAVFSYSPGVTDDVKAHVHLFAIPKDATWRVIDK